MSTQLLKIPGNIITTSAGVGAQTSGSEPVRNSILKVKNMSANYLDVVGTTTSGVQSVPRTLKLPGRFYTPLDSGVTVNGSTWTPEPPPVPYTFNSNQINITIPSGQASVYPVTFTVGDIGTVSSVSFKLNGYSHTYVEDVGMVLYAPDQTKFTIIAGRYGNDNVADYAAVTFSPTETTVWDGYTSGSYLNYTTPTSSMTDLGPHGNFFSGYVYPNLTNAFTGTNANGIWELYIKDYFIDDGGSLQNAQLIITT
jgi:subtilisin-like proprotein convertase family protein